MHDSRPALDALSRIVAAYAGRPEASVEEVVALTAQVAAVLAIDLPAEAPSPAPAPTDTPALPPEKAVTRDKVFCLCCGKGFRMLKRHIGSEHGLTEAEYRLRFGLPDDFPLTAPSFSRMKADYARKAGLGKYERAAAGAELG